MHLERADGGDDDRGRGLEASLAALDVEELFGAEIGAEAGLGDDVIGHLQRRARSEEHTSELQSLMRISYAVFCLKKTTQHKIRKTHVTPCNATTTIHSTIAPINTY